MAPSSARDVLDPCPADGPWPFESVRLHRLTNEAGEPTGVYGIEGCRPGGVREVSVEWERLWTLADRHLRLCRGKSFADPHDAQEFSHAIIRAAVMCLMD